MCDDQEVRYERSITRAAGGELDIADAAATGLGDLALAKTVSDRPTEIDQLALDELEIPQYYP